MTNPFPYSGFWFTPESVDELFEYCNRFSGGEKTVALNIAMMAMNFAHKTVEKEIDNAKLV